MGIHASFPKIEIQNLNHKKVVIWWHSAIKKNHRDKSQPNVVVSLRVVNDDGSFGSIEKRQFPITYLGFLRIGSIWLRGQMVGHINMETVYFSGCISNKNIQLIRQGIGVGVAPNRKYVIPPHIHSLEDDYYHNKSWLLQMQMTMIGENNQSAQLIVPCMEVFNRLYGRNSEVRRILTTYPWSEASKRLFVSDSRIENNTEAWAVELPNRMINDDTHMIAYFYHDQFAQMQAKSIYAQIESSQGPRESNQTFLKVKPWYVGNVLLKVKGFWIDNKHFLGLQINGANIQPHDRTIIRSRSSGMPIKDGNIGEGETGKIPTKNISKVPEVVNVTGNVAPDRDSGHLRVAEEDFEILGDRGKVIRRNYNSPYQGRHHKSDKDDSEKFSAGEAHGGGKGVGKAEMRSELVIESEGMLIDIWNALVQLSRSEPCMIKKVEYFSEGEFIEGERPSLVAFASFFSTKEEFQLSVTSWGYMSVRKGELRGALIARVLTKNGHVYFIEIQRRKHLSRSNENDIKEESYRGVVFKPHEEDKVLVQSAIKKVMRNLAINKGKLTLSPSFFEGEISTYVHRTKSVKNDYSGKTLMKSEMCQSIIRNALRKVMR